MARSSEATAQRRKLLGEIERLAEIAVFGTLSETYRTCGRAGCHCQGDGPKHGPHLNVSYRGEKGKTTGYYVPNGAEESTRQGVAAWQQMQQCLRELAELNKERNLRRARGRFMMKPCCRLALLCWVLVCLLLSLTQAIGLNHPTPVVGSGPWFDRGRESASDWSTAAVVRSMEFDPVHPGSLASVVLDCTGTAGNLAPPGLETHGPPEPIGRGKLPVKQAAQSNAIEQLSPRNYWPSTAELQNRGFATAFS